MEKMKKKQKILVVLSVIIIANSGLAQTSQDIMHVTEARVAFEKYHDCKIAMKSLNEISPEGKKSDLCLYYLAKVNACLGNYKDAIDNYEAYSKLKPLTPTLIEELADLKYQYNKQQEQQDNAARDQERRQREAEEQNLRRVRDLSDRYDVEDLSFLSLNYTMPSPLYVHDNGTMVIIKNANDDIKFSGTRAAGNIYSLTGSYDFIFNDNDGNFSNWNGSELTYYAFSIEISPDGKYLTLTDLPRYIYTRQKGPSALAVLAGTDDTRYWIEDQNSTSRVRIKYKRRL